MINSHEQIKTAATRLAVWLSALVLVIFAQLARAELVLEVTQGNDKLTTVAVSPFSWSGKTLLPEDLAAIVDNDLKLSGLFAPLPRDNMLSFPSKETEVYYRDWKVLGASYLVTGQVEQKGDSYSVSFQLFDIIRQNSILTGKVQGQSNQMRALAHYVSDAVYEKITGIKGDFSTRLLYITAEMIRPAGEKVRGKKTIKVPPLYDYQLKYADADGKRVRMVFRSREPILSPSWSPDGRQVAYVSFESGRSMIFIQDLATGKRTQLAAYKGLNSSPAWSPDGRKIAFTLSKDGNPNIYVQDLATGKLSRLTSHYSIDAEPDWMPDGNSIVFTSNRGGSPQVYQLDVVYERDGQVMPKGEARRLTFDGRFNARAKVFPDGKSLALVHKGQRATEFNIAIQDLDTGRLRLLTSATLEDSPSVAPGGRRLIYSAQGGANGELGIVSADGRVKYRLPSASGDIREPVWGPAVNLVRADGR